MENELKKGDAIVCAGCGGKATYTPPYPTDECLCEKCHKTLTEDRNGVKDILNEIGKNLRAGNDQPKPSSLRMNIANWWQQRKYKKTVLSVRQSFLSLGHDLSHLTDEELGERLMYASKKIACVGVSVQQASMAFRATLASPVKDKIQEVK